MSTLTMADTLRIRTTALSFTPSVFIFASKPSESSSQSRDYDCDSQVWASNHLRLCHVTPSSVVV